MYKLTWYDGTISIVDKDTLAKINTLKSFANDGNQVPFYTVEKLAPGVLRIPGITTLTLATTGFIKYHDIEEEVPIGHS